MQSSQSRKDINSIHLRKGSIIEIEIDKMACGGNGPGRLDGMVVFVRGTVPGNRITARIDRKKRSMLRRPW